MTTEFGPKVVAPAEGKTVALFGVRFGYKLVGDDTGGNLAALEVTIPARTLVKPHLHSREDEFSVVLTGTVGIRTGDQVTEAGAGSYLARACLRSEGSEPFADGGDVEGCFVADGEFVVAGGDSAVAFELVDAALDGVALLVGFPVEGGGPAS
jgi:hypothetical protein